MRDDGPEFSNIEFHFRIPTIFSIENLRKDRDEWDLDAFIIGTITYQDLAGAGEMSAPATTASEATFHSVRRRTRIRDTSASIPASSGLEFCDTTIKRTITLSPLEVTESLPVKSYYRSLNQ